MSFLVSFFGSCLSLPLDNELFWQCTIGSRGSRTKNSQLDLIINAAVDKKTYSNQVFTSTCVYVNTHTATHVLLSASVCLCVCSCGI